MPAFVEEVLRFRPPIDGWLWLTKYVVSLDGVHVPAGARTVPTHLTFGYGPHLCIGGALARLEAQVALTG